jgi:hypothetical protein
MTRAMLLDATRPQSRGYRCTYLSLRRTIRALVNNRIAGGRLDHGISHTTSATRGIIYRAFRSGGISERVASQLVNAVADNAPDPFSRASSDPNDPEYDIPRNEDQRRLRDLLAAFFAGDAPQQPLPNRPVDARTMSSGEMAYTLWQTITDGFEDDRTTRNFDQAHIGGGGAGAIDALGLGQYHAGCGTVVISNDAALDRRVASILTGLRPGATVQFWRFAQDFLDIQQRRAPDRSPGHSPIFVRYDGPANAPTGIVVIDQFGETLCPVVGTPGHRRIDWSAMRPWAAGTGWMPELWIASNWSE